jgi:hypothetical protein
MAYDATTSLRCRWVNRELFGKMLATLLKIDGRLVGSDYAASPLLAATQRIAFIRCARQFFALAGRGEKKNLLVLVS